jgi:signal transduction histidine kinase
MLFALQLDISSAKSNLRKDINRAEQILENSEAKLSLCMKEASSICYQLSPRLLDDFGLVEALEDLVEKIKTTSPLQINMTKKWSRRKKNKSLETALFRVSQEALANILRHSGASHVFIRLFEEENGITFSVADDGKGFDLFTQKRGFGLMNMKERIEIIGGQFEIETAPHKGTKIEVWLPPRIKDHNE